MADHLVSLPSTWRFLDQFAHTRYAPKPSLMLCGECSSVMAGEVAYPGRFIPEEEVARLCQQWTGKPDDVSNTIGSTIEEVLGWLESNHIGHIDMQPLVNEFQNGNREPLRMELGHMNAQGVSQIVTVIDEEPMYEAVPNPNHNPNDATSSPYIRGAKLHPWAKPGQYSHVIYRVGYSDSDGYGLYADPAAAAFCEDAQGKFKPVKILWSDILAAGIMHCVAIMPYGVAAPPPGFSYTTGVWPVPPAPPKPEVPVAEIMSEVQAFKAQLDQERAASDANFAKILAELGAHL